MTTVQSHPSPETAAAAQVQAFYERYPYPGPIDSLDPYRQLWADPQRRRADHHLFQPGLPYREDPSILIAGCGTSQAARHAVRWPGARVTGIDFSATSVRCTDELKRRYGLDNLELHQLPVERASELGMQFDQVVCTGVLHHLADPVAGLQALRSVLPSLAGQFVSLIKDSSLLSVIGLNEFTQSARNVASYTYSNFESYLLLAAGYLLLTLPISVWTRRMEQRFRYET